MNLEHIPSRRGLTILELMLSLTITVLVGAAITAMLGAVATGAENRRDSRTHLLHANAAQIRLSAYIGPSLCVLGADGGNLTLWFNDSRRSGTVHATEIRWLRFEEATGSLTMYLIRFPATWTERQRLLADHEFGPATNWDDVFRLYRTQGWIAGVQLVDNLESAAVSVDHSDPKESRHVTYRLVTSESNTETLVSGTLRDHRKPE